MPGGSNSAVAEYAGHCGVDAAAAVRLGRRRDQGRPLRSIPRPHGRRQSQGIEGLTVGLIGFGTIGRAVAPAFHRMGAKLCVFDAAAEDAALANSLGASTVTLDELLATSDWFR